MPELTIFGLSLLAVLAVWRLVLRKSIQDAFKDMLFDERDRMRAEFHALGMLDTVAYRDVRDLINRHIRFVERAGLMQTLVFSAELAKAPELEKELMSQADAYYAGLDPRIKDTVLKARMECVAIIQTFVMHSSFYSVVFLYFIYLPFFVARLLCKLAIHKARMTRSIGVAWRTKVQRWRVASLSPDRTEIYAMRREMICCQ